LPQSSTQLSSSCARRPKSPSSRVRLCTMSCAASPASSCALRCRSRALALHRLVTAESARFPKLVRLAHAESATQEAKALIGNLLAGEYRDPRFTIEARGFAAEQFLVMVVAQPQRRAMGLGAPLTPGELDAWTENVVTLFLNGCRGWSAASARRKVAPSREPRTPGAQRRQRDSQMMRPPELTRSVRPQRARRGWFFRGFQSRRGERT
jgi:hypothetical protein